MGTLVKVGDKYQSITTDLNGHVSELFSTTTMFNDSLSAQWMTSEVLTETLKNYADETTEIGRKAFAAAQDVKTFSQLLDTLKESAQSGWTESWQLIVGDYEEAKGTLREFSSFFSGILDFLNVLTAGGAVAALKKFLDPTNKMKDTFKGFVDWVKGMGSGVSNILDGVRGSLEAWQTKLKSDSLGKIAAAIGVLSVSLLVLSAIDSEKLNSAITAITTLFVELTASMAILDKLSINGKVVDKTASAMVKIGASLLILSSAMKNIARLEPAQLVGGLVGVGVLLAEINLFLRTARFDKNASKSAKDMLLFAAAIKILASAVQSLGSMNWEDMAKGLVGVGAL